MTEFVNKKKMIERDRLIILSVVRNEIIFRRVNGKHRVTEKDDIEKRNCELENKKYLKSNV